jgi:hypothetical protein
MLKSYKINLKLIRLLNLKKSHLLFVILTSLNFVSSYVQVQAYHAEGVVINRGGARSVYNQSFLDKKYIFDHAPSARAPENYQTPSANLATLGAPSLSRRATPVTSRQPAIVARQVSKAPMARIKPKKMVHDPYSDSEWGDFAEELDESLNVNAKLLNY